MSTENVQQPNSNSSAGSAKLPVMRNFTKLEVGKSYVTKEGKKVTITECDNHPLPYLGVYEDGGLNRWYEDGLSGYRNGSHWDLVNCV